MKSIIGFFILMFLNVTHAGELYEDNRSLRALGMGGVYIPFVRDTEAVFFNPAALAFVDKIYWKIANIGVGINGLDLLKASSSIDSTSDYAQYYGVPLWVGLNAKTAIAVPYFGMAGYSDSDVTLQLNNPAYPVFNTKFRSDYGFIMGGAFKLTPGLALGITGKRIARWAGDQDLGVGTIANASTVSLNTIKENFQNKGVGYGTDIAIMGVLGSSLLETTVAAVWEDVGFTTFQKTDGAEAPARIRDTVSVAAGLSSDLPGLDLSVGAEFRHLTDSSEQIGKKIHLGTELSLPFIDLRTGMSQGYTSYGVGLSILFIQLDAVMYKEELGYYPGQNPQDRIQVGLSIDLSLDADFRILNQEGKKRKLKQRR